MSRLVDAEEGKETRLLHLTVDNVVARGDVGEASIIEARGVDLVGYDVSTPPIAIVIA